LDAGSIPAASTTSTPGFCIEREDKLHRANDLIEPFGKRVMAKTSIDYRHIGWKSSLT